MVKNRVLDGLYVGERVLRTRSDGLVIETDEGDIPLNRETVSEYTPLDQAASHPTVRVRFTNGLSSTLQIGRSMFEELQAIFQPDTQESADVTTQKAPPNVEWKKVGACFLVAAALLFSAVLWMNSHTAAPAEPQIQKSTIQEVPEYMSSWTDMQKAAHRRGLQYLESSPFSRQRLAEQLEYEGYSQEDAIFGASSIQVDWKEQAQLKALAYLQTSAFSKSGLLDQLLYEGFTADEAAYGVDLDVDWTNQALLKAKSYLITSAFSRQGLADQLAYEGFSESEASFGADQCGADWMEQAVIKAKSYRSMMAYTTDDLMEQLKFEGFTYEEALHGATCS